MRKNIYDVKKIKLKDHNAPAQELVHIDMSVVMFSKLLFITIFKKGNYSDKM